MVNYKIHIQNGFPHYSRISDLCMCLDNCCHSERGCICRTCQCRIRPNGHSRSASISVNTISSDGTEQKKSGVRKRRVNGGKNSNG